MASEAEAVKIQEGVAVDAVVPTAAETSAQRKILLKSAEGEEFLVDELFVRGSKTIGNMIDDGCAEDGIPLPNVTAPVLSKILEYWKYHSGKSETDKDAKEFDKDFVKDAPSSVLFEVVMAANYLDCKPLLDLTCQAVADAIKDMNVEQVRGYFCITNDFTLDEEAAIREENRWAFD
ncbi:putative S-phase kinase-associated protein [Dioscorea sansibarensis]